MIVVIPFCGQRFSLFRLWRFAVSKVRKVRRVVNFPSSELCILAPVCALVSKPYFGDCLANIQDGKVVVKERTHHIVVARVGHEPVKQTLVLEGETVAPVAIVFVKQVRFPSSVIVHRGSEDTTIELSLKASASLTSHNITGYIVGLGDDKATIFLRPNARFDRLDAFLALFGGQSVVGGGNPAPIPELRPPFTVPFPGSLAAIIGKQPKQFRPPSVDILSLAGKRGYFDVKRTSEAAKSSINGLQTVHLHGTAKGVELEGVGVSSRQLRDFVVVEVFLKYAAVSIRIIPEKPVAVGFEFIARTIQSCPKFRLNPNVDVVCRVHFNAINGTVCVSPDTNL